MVDPGFFFFVGEGVELKESKWFRVLLNFEGMCVFSESRRKIAMLPIGNTARIMNISLTFVENVLLNVLSWGCRDGAVVRVLASHQCGPLFDFQIRRHM